jgi:glycosidase
MKKSSCLLLFLLVFLTGSSYSQIKDLIQPLRLIPGETDSILVSDIFYSESYDLSFEDNPVVDIVYNSTSKILVLRPSSELKGIELLRFSLEGRQYVLPVLPEEKFSRTFVFRPETKPGKVNLFGSFNGWNREIEPMYDNDNDGTYEAAIKLEPGRYEYKFFVDGKELFDPVNPEKVSNGIGDFNSIITVKAPDEAKTYLHKLSYTGNNDNLIFAFSLTPAAPSKNSSIELNKDEVVALLDNTRLPAEGVTVTKNKVNISVDKKLLSGYTTLRVAVNKNGSHSNVQTVFINNGKLVTAADTKLNQGDIIYSLMIDRFYDGDKSNSKPVIHDSLSTKANYNGGDFRGIINKLNAGYFDSLGINTIWVSPVIQNTDSAYREYPEPHRWFTGYHGYWPTHPTEVEEHFGDIDLLKELIQTAHKHNIKILLDYVAHHVHIEHPFWKEHPGWFGTLDLPDGRKNLRLWDEQRLTTWFEPYMPSFDFTKSKEALEVMTDNAVWWLKETGADGFRHDAVKHVPNEFWRLLTQKIKKEIAEPNNITVYQIGETFGGYDLISSYVNNGQLSAQFNFNLYDTAIPVFTDENVAFSALDDQMQKTFAVYGVNHVMGNIMDSHDKVRFMAYADGDLAGNADPTELGWNNPPNVEDRRSYDKLKVFLTYLTTIPGIPVIYYGDEFGMTGASDPDNRRMMRFGNELSVWEQRALIDVRKLVSLRKNHAALKFGDFLTLKADKNIYAYLRSDFTERILVVLNKGLQPEQFKLEFPSAYTVKEVVDLLSGEKYLVNNNSIHLKMPSWGYKLFMVR